MAATLLVGCSDFLPSQISESKSYIVVFRDAAILAEHGFRSHSTESLSETTRFFAASVADDHSVDQPEYVFQRSLRGGLYRMSAEAALELAQDSRIQYIEEDREVRLQAVQTNAPWGLDRLDQASLPLDRRFEFQGGASGVKVYVIDTGINIQHVEFDGRAAHGFDAIDNDLIAEDCNGHGTHVAGTVGGRTYGVAKDVQLVSVRVLDCRGSGTISSVIRGIEWVTENSDGPSVVNMSLGGGASQAIDDAVRKSMQNGILYVVAAGNENMDACQSSPARVSQAITVGSTTSSDSRSSFSNYGSCVDIFAPGSDIPSAWYSSTSATQTISGTSMASPHVAGVAALILGGAPTLSIAELTRKILEGSRAGRISNLGVGSPNRLLAVPSDDPTEPVPDEPEPGVTRMVLDTSLSGMTGATGDEKYLLVTYPAGTRAIEFRIDGSNGDADLYVRKGLKPNAREFDCRPYLNGSREVCKMTNLSVSGGKIYVRLHAYRSYTGVTLSVRRVSN